MSDVESNNEKPPQDVYEDEEMSEDDDIDALIEELQSHHGMGDDDDSEDEGHHTGSARVVPEEYLQTDPSYGLTSDEVAHRRKKYGLNQMADERESMIVKFVMFFVGPINSLWKPPLSWPPVCLTGSISVLSVVC